MKTLFLGSLEEYGKNCSTYFKEAVYILELKENLVKIGYSTNIDNRLKQHRNLFRDLLDIDLMSNRLLLLFPPNDSSTYELEQKLINSLSEKYELSSGKEWFKTSFDNIIKTISKMEDLNITPCQTIIPLTCPEIIDEQKLSREISLWRHNTYKIENPNKNVICQIFTDVMLDKGYKVEFNKM